MPPPPQAPPPAAAGCRCCSGGHGAKCRGGHIDCARSAHHNVQVLQQPQVVLLPPYPVTQHCADSARGGKVGACVAGVQWQHPPAAQLARTRAGQTARPPSHTFVGPLNRLELLLGPLAALVPVRVEHLVGRGRAGQGGGGEQRAARGFRSSRSNRAAALGCGAAAQLLRGPALTRASLL